MRLLVICSLMTLSFSVLAKIKGPPKVEATKAVKKTRCGTLKPQATIEQTPTTACFVAIEGMEGNEYLALYDAFNATVYDAKDVDAKFLSSNSVTMPAHSMGKIYGVLAKELQGRFAKTRGGEEANVTMNFAPGKGLQSIVVRIGTQIYEYENITLQN